MEGSGLQVFEFVAFKASSEPKAQDEHKRTFLRSSEVNPVGARNVKCMGSMTATILLSAFWVKTCWNGKESP